MWGVIYALVVLVIAIAAIGCGVAWVRAWQDGRADGIREELKAEAARRNALAAAVDRETVHQLVNGSRPLAEVVAEHQAKRAKEVVRVDGTPWDWGPDDVAAWLQEETGKVDDAVARKAGGYRAAVVIVGVVAGLIAAVVALQLGQSAYSG
jgi:hypothetical protein